MWSEWVDDKDDILVDSKLNMLSFSIQKRYWNTGLIPAEGRHDGLGAAAYDVWDKSKRPWIVQP